MKAIEITSPGGPEVLRAAERPDAVAGAGQVLVRVAAAGVNRPDVLQRKGHYPVPPGASDIPGLEIAGEIVAGDAQAMAAAGLPETFFTVWSNVFERARLRPGETLLVHGGTSGIGVTAIQLGKAFGATVIVTAGSADKCAACRALGADHAIDYRAQDFVAEVLRLTQQRGADVILDMVAGAYVARNLQCLAEDGRSVVIAVQGGVKAEIDAGLVLRRRLTLSGSTLRPRSVAFKGAIAQALRDKVWPLLESGAIKPVVHSTFAAIGDPSGAAQAHVLMESNQHIGKIVLSW